MRAMDLALFINLISKRGKKNNKYLYWMKCRGSYLFVETKWIFLILYYINFTSVVTHFEKITHFKFFVKVR